MSKGTYEKPLFCYRCNEHVSIDHGHAAPEPTATPQAESRCPHARDDWRSCPHCQELNYTPSGTKNDEAAEIIPERVQKTTAPPRDLDHPCKDTCSGWIQGYEKGHIKGLVFREAEHRNDRRLLDSMTAERNEWMGEANRLKELVYGPDGYNERMEKLERLLK